MKHQEYDLQKAICRYLIMQYPNVLFMSDTIASLKLTMGQAVRNKAIQCPAFKTPDLIIFHPNESYHGLFIELKIADPFTKRGALKSEHIEGQWLTLQALSQKGYKAEFAWSFDMAKGIIDNYLIL